MGRKAAIYCRISKDRAGAGLGVARQEADCRGLAERLGWDVVSVLVDNDVSAYTGKPRPAYRRLLAMLEDGAVSGVLVWHTDRLHRRSAELEEYVTLAEAHSVETHTVQAGPLDLASPSGRLVARQLGAVASYEVEHARERQQAARMQLVAAGRWAGGARRFGFEPDGVTPRPSEARVVVEATEAVVAGRSVRSIAVDLNRRGVVTSTGAVWTTTTVRRMLLRPRNAGLYEHRGVVVGEAEWPALVDEGLWRACRAVLTDPSRRTQTSTARRWLGAGLFLCGVCGRTVRATSNSGLPSGKVYACGSGERGHVVRAAEHVDVRVTDVVLALLARQAVELGAPVPADVSGLHLDAEVLRGRLDEAADQYAAGTIDARQLGRITAATRKQLAEVEGRLSVALPSPLSRFVGVDPAVVWAVMDVGERRTVVETLVTVTLHRGRQGRPPGWKPGRPYFDPSTVEVTPRPGPVGMSDGIL